MKFRWLSEIFLALILAGLAVSENSLNCNFDGGLEDNPRCGWSNDLSDEFDWTLTRFPTPTPFTGPSGDHTTGVGNYLYTEANGRNVGNRARIYSPFDAPSNVEGGNTVTVLTFWYSMWESFPAPGPNMGTLNVYLAYGGNKVPGGDPVWSAAGPHTGEARWKEARIMFRAPGPFRIIFEGVIGDGDRSDIGIDDVSVLTTDIPLSCDFESSPLGDLCMLYQEEFNDDFDWTRQSGETPSLDTGPLTDHTFENETGHYMFIETNRQNVPASAQLTSLPYFKYDGLCRLIFYEHFFGANLGELRVRIYQDDVIASETFLSLGSNDTWISTSLDIPTSQGYYYFTFDGRRGDGNLGDIAIDDIELTGPHCSDVDHCLSNPCLNGGTCSTSELGYDCACAPGWLGESCAENVDNCSPNDCPEGYNCIDLINGFDCVCPPGYYGEGCSQAVTTPEQPAPIDTIVDGVDPEKIPVIIGSCVGSFVLIITAAWFTATCIKQDGFRRKDEVDVKEAEEGGGNINMYMNTAYIPDDADKADEATDAKTKDAGKEANPAVNDYETVVTKQSDEEEQKGEDVEGQSKNVKKSEADEAANDTKDAENDDATAPERDEVQNDVPSADTDKVTSDGANLPLTAL